MMPAARCSCSTCLLRIALADVQRQRVLLRAVAMRLARRFAVTGETAAAKASASKAKAAASQADAATKQQLATAKKDVTTLTKATGKTERQQAKAGRQDTKTANKLQSTATKTSISAAKAQAALAKAQANAAKPKASKNAGTEVAKAQAKAAVAQNTASAAKTAAASAQPRSSDGTFASEVALAGTKAPDTTKGTTAEMNKADVVLQKAVGAVGKKPPAKAGGKMSKPAAAAKSPSSGGPEQRDSSGKFASEVKAKQMDKGVGGGVDRDKIPAEDFAGPGRTYPIVTPGDVADAGGLIGHASDPAAVKAKIQAIAKRKGPGFVAKLPASWTAKKAVEMSKGTVKEPKATKAPKIVKEKVHVGTFKLDAAPVTSTAHPPNPNKVTAPKGSAPAIGGMTFGAGVAKTPAYRAP